MFTDELVRLCQELESSIVTYYTMQPFRLTVSNDAFKFRLVEFQKKNDSALSKSSR